MQSSDFMEQTLETLSFLLYVGLASFLSVCGSFWDNVLPAHV